MSISEVDFVPPIHGAGMSTLVIFPVPVGLQASHGLVPGAAVMTGLGVGTENAARCGSRVPVPGRVPSRRSRRPDRTVRKSRSEDEDGHRSH